MAGQQLLDGLSCRDKLLFSQAVYELGSDAWPAVSKLLLQHPLIELPRAMLAPQSCSDIYMELVAELPPTIEGRDDDAAAKKPHARLHLRLAQKHYKARVEELRETISAEEAEFAALATEVEQLQSGAWDEKLVAEMRAKTAGKPTNIVAEQDKPAADDKEVDAKDGGDAESGPQDADDEIVDTTLQLDNHESDVAESTKPSRAATPPAADQAKDEADSATDAPAEEASKPADVVEEDGAAPVSVHATSPLATTAPPDEPKASPKPVAPSSPASAKPTPKEAEEPEAPAPPSKKPGKPTRTSRRTRNHRSPSPTEDAERETTAEPPSATTEKHPEDAMQVDEEPASAVTEREVETPQKAKPESRLASTTSPQTTNVTPDAAEKAPQTAPRPNTRKGKRKADTDKELSVRPVKRLREASENMDTADEYEVSTPVRRTADPDAQKQFQKFITVLHAEISGHRTGNIFHKPVTKAEAPDYYDVVKRPMDLSTIKRRFNKSNEISDPIEYQRDLNLMFCNSLMYNRPNSDLHQMAKSMMVDCEKTVQEFFQAHDVPQERPR